MTARPRLLPPSEAVVRPVAEPLLLRAHQVASLLNVSRSTAYAWMQDGTLPTVTIGTTKRCPRADLLEWLAARTRPGRRVG